MDLTPATPTNPAIAHFGDFELLEEIARGGMGVVYRARQISLNRIVALKMIPFAALANATALRRFQAEASAAGRLKHPHIVSIHEAGVQEGQPFIVMEYVEGSSLAQIVQQRPLPAARAVAYLKPIAEAVHYAHTQGILHRDLKPSNILVGSDDRPQLTDFGLAKQLTLDSSLTLPGDTLGSPHYIPPEQCGLCHPERSESFESTQSPLETWAERAASPSSAATSRRESRTAVNSPQPARDRDEGPFSDDEGVNRVESIPTKNKIGPASDVYGLGAILYHLVTGRPPFQAETIDQLLAQVREVEPPSPRLLNPGLPRDLEVICLKCLEKEPSRRYPSAQALADDLDRFLRGEPIHARPVTSMERGWRWCRRRPGTAALAGGISVLLLVVSLGGPLAAYRISQSRQSAVEEGQRARQAERLALQREAEARSHLYAANLNLIGNDWERDNFARLRQLLGEASAYPDHGFEWNFWQKRLHLEQRTLRGHLTDVASVAISNDGQHIVTGGKDGVAIVWDAASGRELSVLEGHAQPIRSVAISPDGRWIATASDDHTVRVWETATGREKWVLRGHLFWVMAVAFSPNGDRIASAGGDARLKIWETATGRLLSSLPPVEGGMLCVAFTPDGKRIATGGNDATARIFEIAAGREEIRFQGHSADVFSVAFSGDGQWLVTGSQDRTAKVWEVETGRERLTLRGHTTRVNAAAISSDQRWIVTGSTDYTARLWDAATGRELRVFRGHFEPVLTVAISHDGGLLVTGSGDRTAKLWNLSDSGDSIRLVGHTQALRSVAFSPDGGRVVTGGDDQTAKVWDALTGREIVTFTGHKGQVWSVGFSPDGASALTTSEDLTARVWDAETGRERLMLTGHAASVQSATYSPDGRYILTGSSDRTAALWDAETGRRVRVLSGHKEMVRSVAFSPDGRKIATAGWDKTVKVWETKTGRQLLDLKGPTDWMWSLRFSPDGRRMAAGSYDGTAKVWEVADGREVFVLRGYKGAVYSVQFSPDGRRLLTAEGRHSATLWDAATGRDLLTLRGHSNAVISAAFSPDGRRVVTASEDTTARIWNTASPEHISRWQKEEEDAAIRLAQRERERTERQANERRERNRPESAIKSWLVLGPVPFQVGLRGFAALDLKPMGEENELRPRADQRVRVGERELVWRAARLEDYRIDFTKILGEGTGWSAVYACSYIQSDREHTGVRMLLASGAHSKVYLNGREAFRKGHPYFREDSEMIEGLTLDRGLNVLLLKVVSNDDVGWLGSIRFTDANGQPLTGLRAGTNPTNP